ncbi:hypothetical protein ABZP36_018960 [Zizania latifolia]
MTTREEEQRRQHGPSSDGPSGGVDLTDYVPDDILVHILGLLPTMADVLRACAVSRRWGLLAARVPSLRFAIELIPDNSDLKHQNKVDRFITFINHVLAKRAVQSDGLIEELSILFEPDYGSLGTHQVPTSIIDGAHVKSWIKYGMQHVTKSLVLMLDLPLPSWWSINEGMVDLHELPNSTRLETMMLSLKYASLRLPATVVAFNSLTDLRLQEIRLTAGSERLFSRLLSSACCPRLRKLSLLEVAGITELQLEAGQLSELTLESFQDHLNGRNLSRLELNTPNLRFLDIDHDILDVLTISAPRLEELTSTFVGWSDIKQLNVGDLSCVRSIKDLELNSDGHPLDDAGIHSFVYVFSRVNGHVGTL